MMPKKTHLIFEMYDYIVDPNSIFINGWLPNWQMLDAFLFAENSDLNEITGDLNVSEKTCRVELNIWVDSDDFTNWIDFDVLSVNLV